MDVIATLASDGALFLLCAVGLSATAVAIVRDTRSQRAQVGEGDVHIS